MMETFLYERRLKLLPIAMTLELRTLMKLLRDFLKLWIVSAKIHYWGI